MAGNARGNDFLLSTATVMVGPVADLLKLNPLDHSLGLVKNFTLSADPQFVELTQGLTNDVVMSLKTGDGSRASCEVYEYTTRNLAYAAGLDGSSISYDPITATFTTSAAATSTTVTLSAAPTGIAAGDWIFIQNGIDDLVHVGKVASISTNTITLTTNSAIPTNLVLAAGSRVGKVRQISMGVSTPNTTLAAKVTAILPQDNKPVTLLFPKIKITRGFNIAFSSDSFGNMPFEFTPYASAMTDPFYGEFGSAKVVMLRQ